VISRFPLGPLAGAGLIAIVGTSVAAEPGPPTITVAPANEVCSLITGDLLKEAKRAIGRFDIACARDILLLAAETTKSPEMTFLLAETFDPDMLSAWQLRDGSNIHRAKAFYEKARELGYPQAQLRIDRLLENWPRVFKAQ
jgi:hypothetical protein